MRTISSRTPIARKEHTCDLCYCTIEKGEEYSSQFNESCGDTYTFKNHISCGEIARALDMYSDCDEGLTEEYFREYIDNRYSQITEGRVMSITEDWVSRLKRVKDYHRIEEEKSKNCPDCRGTGQLMYGIKDRVPSCNTCQ